MILKAPVSLWDWYKIKKLYMRAFPLNERKPFKLIKQKAKGSMSDVWMLDEDGEFLGLAITMNADDLVLLDYFAIHEKKRSVGCGSKALKLLQEKYAVVHLAKEQYAQLDKAAVVGAKFTDYNVSALVLKDKISRGYATEKPSIEDIMLYCAKEVK